MITFREWYKNLDKKIKQNLLDDITKLVMDLYVYFNCPKCKRKLPNELFFTENGCRWCDLKYHKSLKTNKLRNKIF